MLLKVFAERNCSIVQLRTITLPVHFASSINW
jgi:hypothetical protein